MKMEQEEKQRQLDLYCVRPKNNRIKKLVIGGLLLLIFGIPLAGVLLSAGASVIMAAFGMVLGMFGGLFGLILAGILLILAFAAAGVGLIIVGCLNIAQISNGLMLISGGFVLLAVVMLLIPVICWSCFTLVPRLFRICLDAAGVCLKAISALVRRLFGRGGTK